MEETDEELYDDTVPIEAYNEPVTESSQAEEKVEKISDNQPRGSPHIAEQASTVHARQKTNAVKRQSQDKLKTTETPASQETVVIPSTQGLYYFDGEKFIEHRPTETAVYAPGSDYCHVTTAGMNLTLVPRNLHKDVKVHSSLSSGLQTLNINISLNVADLVKNTLAGRRRRRKTRKKKDQRLQTLKLSNYEIVDVPDGGGKQTGTETQSASLRQESVENSLTITEKPPLRPPRLFQTHTSMATVESKVSPKYFQAIYENIHVPVHASRMQTEENVLKRSYSVSAFLTPTGATGSATDGTEHPCAKVGDSAHELYSSDLQIQTEVKNLLDNHDWCYVYTNRQAAETKLSDENSLDGSFAVICEDIGENHHFPFTLLLKHHGKVTRTPIKKVKESRGKKKYMYELLNAKKDSVEKLIKHFKEKQLPDYKLKLL